MRIKYRDNELRLLAEDPEFVSKRWSREVVRAYRKKIAILSSANDERDLRALKSLRLEQLKGDRAGTSSIRINKKLRLILKFETDESGRLVIVIEMVDYH